MRGLGWPDSIPAGDLGLRAGIGRACGLGRTATEAAVRALAGAWAGWRGWAAYCWWLALQLEAHPALAHPAGMV
jgi:DNA-3-methyladenine glycosylase II